MRDKPQLVLTIISAVGIIIGFVLLMGSAGVAFTNVLAILYLAAHVGLLFRLDWARKLTLVFSAAAIFLSSIALFLWLMTISLLAANSPDQLRAIRFEPGMIFFGALAALAIFELVYLTNDSYKKLFRRPID